MATVMVTYAQLAAAALSAMETAQVKADDNTLALTTAARGFLRDVASGVLTVSSGSVPAKASTGASAGSVASTGATMAAPPSQRRVIPASRRGIPPAVAHAAGIAPAAAPTRAIAGVRGSGGVVSSAVTGAPKT